MMKKILLSLVIAVSTMSVSALGAAETVKKTTAVAKKPSVVLPDEPKQWDFLFDKSSDLKAWLRDNGNFLLQGYIRHNHLLCGTYQLGIQFGKGDGCVNVEWISEPVYVSRQRQCNQAVLHHYGSGNVPEAAAKFDEVTCAQLYIKCEGVCGTTDMPKGDDSFFSAPLR